MTTRVLHIITGLGTGGAETSLWQLLSALDGDREGHQVLSLIDRGTMADRIEALGVPVLALGAHRGEMQMGRLAELMRVVRRLAPRVLQGWMYHGNLAASVAAWGCAKRPSVVWNVRHALDAWAREAPRLRHLVRVSAFCSSSARHIIYNSARSADQHARRGFSVRRATVIPNGFDLDRFRPDAAARERIRGELRISDSTPLVGLIARVDPLKDHASFLDAAGRVSRQDASVHFLMAGRGTDHSDWHARIAQAGLEGRVHALGERADVPAVLAALDVATLCSISEGFPNAIGEAMATAVPCVVTDVGDAAALVGETGEVVPPSQPEILALAWSRLLRASRAERDALGALARERVARRYALPVIAQRYRDVYADVYVDAKADTSADMPADANVDTFIHTGLQTPRGREQAA